MARRTGLANDDSTLAADELRALRSSLVQVLRKNRLTKARRIVEAGDTGSVIRGVDAAVGACLPDAASYELRLERVFAAHDRAKVDRPREIQFPRGHDGGAMLIDFAAHHRAEAGSRRKPAPPWTVPLPSVIAAVGVRPSEVRVALGTKGYAPATRPLRRAIVRIVKAREEIENEPGGPYELGTTGFAKRNPRSAAAQLREVVSRATNARGYVRESVVALALRDLGLTPHAIVRALGPVLPDIGIIP